ncbi:DinB family protein [Abyssalbus ytuae]|uniref:DinB family protein n=1 Tax=Abyssalbus ytuae TaxID=2926907 RepID=A0A9E7D1I2_9FLAO|nr:DinB family protein [Abyssalbus ytuae]UOB19345.1 DinB family protein [Abyssalbus ytuae]
MNILIQHIINQLTLVQNGKLWVGSTYQSKLREVSESLVFKRPLPDLHSIAEIISHLTLWREEAILKIKTGTGSKTDDCEENWWPVHKLKLKGWSKIKADYDHSLLTLIELLQNKDDTFLDQKYYDTDFKDYYPYRFLLDGMLHHDIYHLGQLGIIIKFLKEN